MSSDNDSASMLGIGIEGGCILVDGQRTCYVIGTSSVSASFQHKNLWNLVLHLQDPNISDLSLINDLLVYSTCVNVDYISTWIVANIVEMARIERWTRYLDICGNIWLSINV